MRPNVVVVLTDDHAQWAAGCYGNSELRTPTLDYLASTGVQMDEAFTPTPVCSPARASFWTGRIPSQHGLHDYLAESDAEVAGHPWLAGERLLPEYFKEAGYVTGMSGKWHLGKPEKPRTCFDYWYSVTAPVPKPHAYSTPWATSQPAPKAGRYNPHAITDHAVEFLRNRPVEQPFFLFVGYISTHSPWSGHPERLVASYRESTFRDIPQDPTYPLGRLSGEAVFESRNNQREALAQYYASVGEIDEQVGRIIDELDTQGVREDTLFVYTSDHGLNAGHHGLWGKGNATRPYNMLDESIRIPMIMNRPGSLLGGQRRSEMVTHCDLFQTILEHADLAPSCTEREERAFPGRSFNDLCRGKADGTWPTAVFGEYGDMRMIRTASHKLLTRSDRGNSELFDLVRDPRETAPIGGDPANHSLAAELTDRLESYFQTFTDPERSGLRVSELPRHNSTEDWRDNTDHAIRAEPTWIKDLES